MKSHPFIYLKCGKTSECSHIVSIIRSTVVPLGEEKISWESLLRVVSSFTERHNVPQTNFQLRMFGYCERLSFYCQGYDNHSSVPGEAGGGVLLTMAYIYGKALPLLKGVPFWGFWYLKGWGFHLLKYKKGFENLSLLLMNRLRRANSCILWLWKSRENFLV